MSTMSGTIEFESALGLYARLKIQEKEIAKQLEELKPTVLAGLEERGLDKQPTSLGDFTIQKKKSWTYSENVAEQTSRLKQMKDSEEADGTATFEETSILAFKEKKPQV